MTRAHTREAIERALSACDTSIPTFIYLELPWLRRWAVREQGLRHYVYYTLWQFRAALESRRLQRVHRFDVVHHLTYASIWLPNLAWISGAKFLLGPAGGGPCIPVRLYAVLGTRGATRELVRLAAQIACRFNPLVRVGWRRAAVILVQNEESFQALPRRYRCRAEIMPNASVPDELRGLRVPQRGRRTAVSASRLLPWKGLSLAVRALEDAPGWQLVIIGHGPEGDRLRRLVDRRGLRERVRFMPWTEQSELWRFLSSADALVLPSLRDDAPLVAAEALVLGLPVVAFDQGGPAVFARAPGARVVLVPLGSESECVHGLAEALNGLANNGSIDDSPSVDFGIGQVAERLDAVYRTVVAAG